MIEILTKYFYNDHKLIYFRINKTHTFMAGGYGGEYSLCDTAKKSNSSSSDTNNADVTDIRNTVNSDSPNCDDPTIAPENLFGALILKNAWMYDGYEWEELPPMSTTRDRSHCTLISDEVKDEYGTVCFDINKC